MGSQDIFSDIFERYIPLDFKETLHKLVVYGKEQSQADAGAVFILNGATGLLELACASPDAENQPFSIQPGTGFIGSTFKKGKPCTTAISINSPSPTEVPPFLRHRNEIRATVALPVHASSIPIAIFCLWFFQKPGITSGLTGEEQEAITNLQEAFSFPWLGASLQQKRIEHIHRAIQSAGEMPARLKKAIDEFITNLKISFKEKGKRTPDLLYLQLTDHVQRRIRTVRGFGLPLSFEFLPGHSLDASDIQGDIVKRRHIEIIAGNDTKRFDQNIFRQYQHENYVRLWMPLFPLPESLTSLHTQKELKDALSKHLLWKTKEERTFGNSKPIMQHQEATWKDDTIKPVERLVFGTLEIGYKHKHGSPPLSFGPFKERDFILDCIAAAYGLANDLFSYTFAGVLERIGTRAASIMMTDSKLAFTVRLSPQRHGESRTYPCDPHWKIAIPKRTSENNSGQGSKQITLKYFQDNSTKSLQCLNHKCLNRLQKTIEPVVTQATDVALHLFRAVIYPQELLVPDHDPSYMGTLINDEKVLYVCEEAAKMTNAPCSLVYFFQKKAFPGQEEDQVDDQ